MVWGRRAMERMVVGSANRLAKSISKDDFLMQLKESWRPYVKKHTPIEDELHAAMSRMNNSPFKSAFQTAGIAEEDVKSVLEEIREEKIDPIKYTEAQKVGRNDPCPCGSGLKFKKCCGGL